MRARRVKEYDRNSNKELKSNWTQSHLVATVRAEGKLDLLRK